MDFKVQLHRKHSVVRTLKNQINVLNHECFIQRLFTFVSVYLMFNFFKLIEYI